MTYLAKSAAGRQGGTAVIRFMDASVLAERLDLALGAQPDTRQRLDALIEDTLAFSTRTSHPLFLDKLYAGNDAIGHLGSFLTSILNTNIYVRHTSCCSCSSHAWRCSLSLTSPTWHRATHQTYACAPVFSLMEARLLTTLRGMFGLPRDGGGVMSPGGSYSNMLALLCARNRAYPEANEVRHAWWLLKPAPANNTAHVHTAGWRS